MQAIQTSLKPNFVALVITKHFEHEVVMRESRKGSQGPPSLAWEHEEWQPMSPEWSAERRLRNPAVTGYKAVLKGFGGSQSPKAVTSGDISRTQNTVLGSKSALACIPPRTISSWPVFARLLKWKCFASYNMNHTFFQVFSSRLTHTQFVCEKTEL